jgi:hypothetical protein
MAWRRWAVLLLAPVCGWADDRPLTFSWAANLTQTNGTVIAPADLVVTVYDQFDNEICTGSHDGTCASTQPWDTCVTYYAVATQLSTTLQSAPSSGVESCTGPLPVYDTPPTAPALNIELGL